VAAVLSAAAPAAAAPTAGDCTHAKGRTTCVTTTYRTDSWGPTTTVGTSDGSLPNLWCLLNSGTQYVYYGTSNAVFYRIATTTTVVHRGGAKGHVLSSRTVTTFGDPTYVSGLISCSDGPF